MKPFNNYILRLPALPIGIIYNTDFLNYFYNDSYVNEALYIASPILHAHLSLLIENKIKSEKEIEKIKLSLFRYWNRICSRSTPFGLFASCSIGKLSESTIINLEENAENKISYRLDMNFYLQFLSSLLKKTAIIENTKLFPNNSIYKIGSNLRYTEFILQDNVRTYSLSMVENNPYLESILEKTKNGLTLKEICEEISDEEISKEDIKEYILELIDSQLLLSELEPALTGKPIIDSIIEILSTYKVEVPIVNSLILIKEILASSKRGVTKFKTIQDEFSKNGFNAISKDLVQADSFFYPQQNSFKKTIIEEIVTQINELWVINYEQQKTSDLASFKEKFVKKYQDEEIPLALALDAEYSIGYGDFTNQNSDSIALIKGINQIAANTQKKLSWNTKENFILSKFTDFIANKLHEIEITENDLEQFNNNNSKINLPPTCYILGSIIAKNSSTLDSGEYKFNLISCGVGSAANLISRFSYLDEDIKMLTKEIVGYEQAVDDEVILMEIVHLPQSRIGNILIRPSLREYELSYLGKGNVPIEKTITITDLLVSVKDNEIVLRSKKLNRRVIPKLTSAHNYSQNNLAIYKFLCDLQHQKINTGVYWDWGIFENQKHLPRVKYKNIILERERWILNVNEFDKKDYTNDMHKFKVYLNEILKKRNIPNSFIIAEGDNELLIDTNNDLCILQLKKDLDKKKIIVLIESLVKNDSTLIRNNANYYTHELLIPCFNEKYKKNAAFTSTEFNNSLQRVFMPCSQWLYIKIYCGTSTADTILKEVLYPFITNNIEPVFEKWHFIRYSDPDNHLRIRFYNTSPSLNTTLYNKLLKAISPYIEDGFIRKIQLDTYEREIERYGITTMELSESIFTIDSDCVIEFLFEHTADSEEALRWQFGISAILDLLDEFQFSLQKKYLLLKSISDGFLNEFGNSPLLIKQLNDKYRIEMKSIKDIIENKSQLKSNTILNAILSKRKNSLNNLVLSLHNYNLSIQDLEILLPSYIHMLLNRLFLSNPRKQELVVYYFLQKALNSQIAIQKSTNV